MSSPTVYDILPPAAKDAIDALASGAKVSRNAAVTLAMLGQELRKIPDPDERRRVLVFLIALETRE